jgi:hypothetical protein
MVTRTRINVTLYVHCLSGFIYHFVHGALFCRTRVERMYIHTYTHTFINIYIHRHRHLRLYRRTYIHNIYIQSHTYINIFMTTNLILIVISILERRLGSNPGRFEHWDSGLVFNDGTDLELNVLSVQSDLQWMTAPNKSCRPYQIHPIK